MKIKNIIAALLAVLAITVSCAVEEDHYLSQVKLSTTYVAISMGGGSTPVTIDATDSWSITGMPSWLTVDPASGSAGNGNISMAVRPSSY